MKISVFGLGYVGVVSAACLAADGHDVIGVDPNLTKVDLINRGIAPIVEEDIGDLIASSVAAGRLSASMSVADAIGATALSLICVGTPSQLNGNLDLSHVRRVCEQIGEALRRSSTFHVVVVRSTMLPGSMRTVVIPTLSQASGKTAGVDFGVCINPEFLREGTAIFDYHHPPKTVIGESDARAGNVLAGVYTKMAAPLIRTSVEAAEMIKYVDNSWHALKVAFANEIGNISKAVGIDGHEVMKIFCQDTKLNLSPYYLKPGFAFGGSCLPKDLRALTYHARGLDLDLPLLNSILPSNGRQIDRAIRMVTSRKKCRVGILGFAFKAGTDDLRESPMVDLIEHLLGKGFEMLLYDRHVNIAALTGANKDFILNHIPHISRLMVDSVEQVTDFAETIVVGNQADEFRDVLGRLRGDQVVVDLARISARTSDRQYQGICW